MIITVADFKGDVYIPQKDSTIPVQNAPSIATNPVADNINALILQHEPDILSRSMGAGLYAAFVAGLEVLPIEQRWIALRDGKTYTDEHGHSHYFPGVKGISLYEVYYWYQRNNATQTTNIGEVRNNTENSVRETPAQKMVTADNKRAELTRKMVWYLQANKTVYPEWVSWSCHSDLLKSNNTFGLL